MVSKPLSQSMHATAELLVTLIVWFHADADEDAGEDVGEGAGSWTSTCFSRQQVCRNVAGSMLWPHDDDDVEPSRLSCSWL